MKVSRGEALQEFKKNIPLLDALSDERRQKIMITLGESEHGMTVTKLTEVINISQPAISHHLKQLKELGLVSVQRDGTSNIYSLTIGAMIDQVQHLIDVLRADENLWKK